MKISLIATLVLMTIISGRFTTGKFQKTAAKDMQETNPAGRVLRVMTFNIRYATEADGENAWSRRKEMAAAMLNRHRADISGLQEAQYSQIEDLQKRLPEYDWFGVGRADGKTGGEFSPVFYRRDRLKLLEHHTFWLSATPQKPGSAGWDAAFPRIVTWGKFRDKFVGTIFYFFNTHFDHAGAEARRMSAGLLLKKIGEIAAGQPVIVSGDFNAVEGSPPYQIITAAPDSISGGIHLKDAYYASRIPPEGPLWTFHGFDTVKERPRIDYIFINRYIQVLRHQILPDRQKGLYPSDHLPVMAEVLVKTK
ncbi:MAG: endonuclease/exonuclease/phosphatase family protein [Calditrichia bacterium]